MLQHPNLSHWQPPPGYRPVESALPGITVYAPAPEARPGDALQTFTCPNCGGATRFDVAAGGVACEYCGHQTASTAQQVGRGAQEYEFTMTTLLRSQDGWGVERRELQCENCGAELAIPEGAITATCPFCASNKVNVRTAAADHLRPRFVVPFKVPKEAAHKQVREWLGQGWMHPKGLANIASISQLPGIYLPFWTFDAVITSDWKAEVGYKKTRHTSKGTRTTIKWKWESGRVRTDVDDLLLSGSSHVSRVILERLHPFHLHELHEYTPDYLAGWQAHAYDVTLPDAWDEAKDMMRRQAKNDCYASIRQRSSHIRNFRMVADFADEVWRYILLPVYVSAYVFQGTVYQVMVNGQTGVVAGQKPVAWWKVAAVVAALLVPGLLSLLVGVALSSLAGYSSADNPVSLLYIVGISLIVVSIMVFFMLYRKAKEYGKV